MARVPRRFRRLRSSVNNKYARWHKILVLLALALYLGGVDQTTVVQAAPEANETIFSIAISTSPIPLPACSHSLYFVQYFARVDRIADINGNNLNLQGGLGPPNISVNGVSSDTSIASFHPEALNLSALDNRIGGGADFKLQTGERGSATLTFNGMTEWAGKPVRLPPLQMPIKVVHCKFRVTINSILAASAPYLAYTAVSAVTGELSDAGDASLTGTAEVTSNHQQLSECLNIVIRIPPSQATLTGILNEDGSLLTVRVTYDPAMAFQQNTETCLTGKTVNQQGQFQAPPLEFTVPTTGGNTARPIALPIGDLNLSGTAIISVVPIE